MGYVPGKDFLLKVDFGLGAGFQTIGGIQARRVNFPDTSVEVTHQDSEGNYTERAQGIGKDGMDFSGDGVFVPGPVMVQLLQLRRSSVVRNWQVVIPGLGTYEGPFVIGTLELSGDQGDVMKFSISCMSAGAIGLTPSTATAA